MSADQAAVQAPFSPSSAPSVLNRETLDLLDPRVHELIEAEAERQRCKLVLIASESICPPPVLEAAASCFSNLYAEGYPSTRMAMTERRLLDWDARHLSFYRRYGDRRYYKGCEYVNQIEAEAMARVARLFATETTKAEGIFANVQPLSGAAANNAVYNALVPPQGTVFGMHLSSGGHLTHGSPVNRSGKLYRIVAYEVDPESGQFDFPRMRDLALKEKPSLIIAGYSAYPWSIDWKAFREVADACGACLLADVAHPAGLIVAGEFPNPIDFAHVVSFTTHKTLCGPRGAVLLTTDAEIARKLDLGVFPGEQGGPHINGIAAKAVCFKLAAGDAFKNLQHRVRLNAAALAQGLKEAGLKLAYGGTDSHLCLVDLKPFRGRNGQPVAADIAARVLDLVGIVCNKNAIAGDTRAAHPSGLRFGTTWASQRGLGPEDMALVARIICDVLGSMHGFSITASNGRVGRVRLPAAVLRDARLRIVEMLDRRGGGAGLGCFFYPHYEPLGPGAAPRPSSTALPAPEELRLFGRQSVAARYRSVREETESLHSGAALVDTTHSPVVRVRGERAGIALQQVFTGDVLALDPGQFLATRALLPDGRLLGEFRVLRSPDDSHGFADYAILGESDAALDLLQWLRDLSDGMVAFDTDITRKIDGPIVVEDLGTCVEIETRRALITLAGPRARGIVTQLGSSGARDGQVQTLTPSDAKALVHRLGSDEVFEILVSPAGREDLLRRLLKDCSLVGEAVYLEWRRAHRLTPGEKTREVHDIERTKPYFIGQSALVTDHSESSRTAFVPPPDPSGELLKTPLHSWHQKQTRKWNLVPFAGWEMPVMYTSIVEEHRAVREAAGLFDVAHMGVLEVRGDGAQRFLDLVTTNYVGRLHDGEGQYTYTLSADGHVFDDLLIYRRAADRFLVVVNASNADKVLAWWRAVAEDRCVLDPRRPSVRCDVKIQIIDLKDPMAGAERRVDIALQGGRSLEVLRNLCGRSSERDLLAHLPRFSLTQVDLLGHPVLAAATGYTGESVGFELYVHPDHVVEVWENLLRVGSPLGVRAAGLGARDSTRTEAGFPLYGHELAGCFDITPQEAGYPSFVKWHKPFFTGREALLLRDKDRTHQIFRARVKDPGSRPLRIGDTVVDPKGRFCGRVTSAAYAGADQILLIYGDRSILKRDLPIAIFPLPRNQAKLPAEPPKDALEVGDTVLLPVPAEVIARFLSPAEKRARNYTRG